MRVSGTFLVGVVVVAAVQPWAVGAQEGGEFPADTVAVGLEESATPTIDVALELSRVTFADGAADAVLIGRDDLFADSLASVRHVDDVPELRQPPVGR